jgi:GNAT superfamily N-acetyltransferase
MPNAIRVRPIAPEDRNQWETLWAGYNSFYGREGATALPKAVTDATWTRFFDPEEFVFALVAEERGRLVGIAHYLFHLSTTRIEGVCYLQDLFTEKAQRGRGIGRALILGVYQQASARGVKHVYWQTQESNTAGRQLYDKVARYSGFIVYNQNL